VVIEAAFFFCFEGPAERGKIPAFDALRKEKGGHVSSLSNESNGGISQGRFAFNFPRNTTELGQEILRKHSGGNNFRSVVNYVTRYSEAPKRRG